MGDHGYTQPLGIRYIREQGADTIVRLDFQTVPLQTRRGTPFDFLSRLRRPKIAEVGEWKAVLPGARKASYGLSVRVPAVKKVGWVLDCFDFSLEVTKQSTGYRQPATMLCSISLLDISSTSRWHQCAPLFA